MSQWTCSLCTMLNHHLLPACEICATKREQPSTSRPSKQSSTTKSSDGKQKTHQYRLKQSNLLKRKRSNPSSIKHKEKKRRLNPPNTSIKPKKRLKLHASSIEHKPKKVTSNPLNPPKYRTKKTKNKRHMQLILNKYVMITSCFVMVIP
eukprot:93413_1